MKTRDEILSLLEEMKGEIRADFKATLVGVFGSIVRGEDRETSDVDVLADFEDGATLFDLAGLKLFLEEKTGRKVDVVPLKALRKELREPILKETVYL